MDLKFFGVGSAFNITKDSCSAYFIQDKHIYVIDAGETTHRRLMETIDLNEYNHITFIITHLHNDHIGSLGTSISDIYLNYKIKPTIVFPLDTITNLLTLMGIESGMYNFIKTKKHSSQDLSIEFIETTHSKSIQSFGLVIDNTQSRIYYSGDANAIPPIILDAFKTNKIKKIYQDVTIFENNKDSHLYYQTLLEQVPKHMLDNVYCIHLEQGSEEILIENGLNIARVI